MERAEWIRQNRAKINAATTKWRAKRREHINAYNREWNLRRRKEVLDHYGSKCACCGESCYEFLTIDHINNDGKEHRKLIGQQHLYHWLRKNGYPDGFQILCWNCNSAKHHYGVCPHLAKKKRITFKEE
jgi:hypothetical protein